MIHLRSQSNEKVILNECFKIAAPYEKEILRYLQIKHYRFGGGRVIPQMDLTNIENTKSTDYISIDKEGGWNITPKAIQETMEDLFGFHKIIN